MCPLETLESELTQVKKIFFVDYPNHACKA